MVAAVACASGCTTLLGIHEPNVTSGEDGAADVVVDSASEDSSGSESGSDRFICGARYSFLASDLALLSARKEAGRHFRRRIELGQTAHSRRMEFGRRLAAVSHCSPTCFTSESRDPSTAPHRGGSSADSACLSER